MALELKDIKYSYPQYAETGEKPFSLDIDSITVPENSITMILGKSASGKTTLTSILEGTIPHLYKGEFSGNISYKGDVLDDIHPGERLEFLSAARQNADEQIICNRCDEEAALTLESLGIERNEIEKRITNAFEITGIEQLRNRSPASLSGGEKKKLTMASLIALDPAVYILDESFEEIDSASCQKIIEYFHKNKKTVVLFASRLQKEYLKFCSHFVLIDEKKTLQSDDIDSLMPEINRSGLNIEISESYVSENEDRSDSVLVDLKDICFSYPGNPDFRLQAVSLAIHENECISIVGGNGSGKSTIAKILCGLLKPETGSVSFSGSDVSFSSLCTKTGYVFQNPDFQLFQARIENELSVGDKKADIRKIAGLFELPGLSAPAAMLSYGTRKKLQCAVFYALDRKLVILDEADSGMSPQDISRIIRLFRKKGSAVIIITHDNSLAEKTGRKVVFASGKITEDRKC